MHVKRLRLIEDQRGTTLVEMLVAISISAVLLIALTTLIITTMHASARDSEDVNATQVSRVGLSRIVQELQSSCIFPRVAPLQAESSGTKLVFTHARGSEVNSKPVKSEILFEKGKVLQYDYPWVSGLTPPWTFSKTKPSPLLLMSEVSPLPGKTGIFSYYSASNGQISSTPLLVPLEAQAATAIQVTVALRAAPAGRHSANESTPTQIQDSALLRLTVPSFNETVSPPCE